MLVETVLAMMTLVSHLKHVMHRRWDYLLARLAFMVTVVNILVQPRFRHRHGVPSDVGRAKVPALPDISPIRRGACRARPVPDLPAWLSRISAGHARFTQAACLHRVRNGVAHRLDHMVSVVSGRSLDVRRSGWPWLRHRLGCSTRRGILVPAARAVQGRRSCPDDPCDLRDCRNVSCSHQPRRRSPSLCTRAAGKEPMKLE